MTGEIQFPDIVQLAVPFFIVALLAEIVAIRFFRAGGAYETRDTLTSLLMGAGNVAVGLALGFVAYGFFTWLAAFRLFDLGTSVAVIALCFILDDLRYYWVHRIGHRCRWVWASHVNHHSSQHYNLSTALRQTWTYDLTLMMVVRVPLILLGFSPEMVIFCGGLNLVYQFWIHTEAIDKTPRWFEAVMNTPSHHRVHHGRPDPPGSRPRVDARSPDSREGLHRPADRRRLHQDDAGLDRQDGTLPPEHEAGPRRGPSVGSGGDFW